MLDNVGFTMRGLEDYFHWQNEDRRTVNKINKLIIDIVRNGNSQI